MAHSSLFFVCIVTSIVVSMGFNRTNCHLPGPESDTCRASIPRFFFNETSERCVNVTYGGCNPTYPVLHFEDYVNCTVTCGHMMKVNAAPTHNLWGFYGYFTAFWITLILVSTLCTM